MNHPYKTREGGATVTVFVPYDCGNHCPFCINKEEYGNPEGFSVEKICDSIRRMDRITPRCDFVFTGGEPFANLPSLQIMLDQIPSTHKIYINTTLPLLKQHTQQDILDFVGRNRDKLTCINVSRHLVKYVEESPDALLKQVSQLVPLRINCVLYKNYPFQDLVPYLERVRLLGLPLQFRFDYTDTTPENLYEEDTDKILQDLHKVADYQGLDGCRMRCGFHFGYKDLHITYHKTLPYSTIVETGDDGVTYDILYDILIKQTGVLHSDWDGTLLDVDAYRKVVYEPYDLKDLVMLKPFHGINSSCL